MDNDTFLIILGFFAFGTTTLTTLSAVLGEGRTSFKNKIKGIFISLLINFIIYLLFYIFVITKFYIGFIVVIPIFLFINTINGPDNPDGF